MPWLRLFQQQQVQRPKHDAVRLARARAGDHEQRSVEMPHDRTLGIVELREALGDGWRNAHNKPALRKLKVSSADTIR